MKKRQLLLLLPCALCWLGVILQLGGECNNFASAGDNWLTMAICSYTGTRQWWNFWWDLENRCKTQWHRE